MKRFFVLASLLLTGFLAFGRALAAPQDAKPDREALEEAFEELLSGAKLVGSFTDDSNPDAPPLRDSYTIASAEKIEGDRWSFQAQIEYRETPISVPLVLQVKWAGDTPVITLDDLAIPGLGTFTARVLFHGGSYAGIWRGPGHGGQMFGRVERAAQESEGGGK